MTPNYTIIPDHMQEGLRLYLEEGLEPGSFLRLMLEHRIYEAAGRADPINLHAIPQYIFFMYNYVPMMAHGSEEKVAAWIKFKKKEREDGN